MAYFPGGGAAAATRLRAAGVASRLSVPVLRFGQHALEAYLIPLGIMRKFVAFATLAFIFACV